MIPLNYATKKARQLVEILRPAADRIEIAGSIRRQKAGVEDIEIVVQPRVVPTPTLFRNQPVLESALDNRLIELKRQGVVRLDKDLQRDGDRYKRLIFSDIPVDLFIVIPPATWGVILAIRTGSAEFSHKLVTSALKGGCVPPGMVVKNGALWSGGEALATDTEEELFEILGVPWIEPQERDAATITRYLRGKANA